MIGCCVWRKCLVACLFFESSQQPTCPHVRHKRRCTHSSPVFRQSSHPSALGVTSRIWVTCEQGIVLLLDEARSLACGVLVFTIGSATQGPSMSIARPAVTPIGPLIMA